MKTNENLEIQNILGKIRKLTRTVLSDTAETARCFSLTASQSKIIRCLDENGPKSSAQLSRMLSINPSNMTGIVDRLQKKGLVNRVPKIGDRRVMLITLTPAGKKIGENLPDTAEHRLISGLENMEKSEVRRLNVALDTIIGLMKN